MITDPLISESLLQFIWRYGYFNRQQLYTTAGEPLAILFAGNWNKDQGPDFTAAKIRIGTILLVGQVELHIRASDWYRHAHGPDPHYRHTILHVVWIDDMPVDLPTLVLEPLVPAHLLQRYRQLLFQPSIIPCHPQLPALHELAWYAWKERLVVSRLERKTGQLLEKLAGLKTHWEELCWQQLAAGFGRKVNTLLFEQVALSLPISLLARHRNKLHQLEALLLGQARLLEGKPKDDYQQMLQTEFLFLQQKYRLARISADPAFLRMRPAGFPTIRLAQLAMLLHKREHFFAQCRQAGDWRDLIQLLEVQAGEYWHHHYCFGKATAKAAPALGSAMQQNLLINVLIPLLFADAHQQQQTARKERLIQWLYQLPAEQNTIIRYWKQANISARTAMDTQALLELYTQYCVNKRCLDCAVGNKILGPGV